MRCQIIFTRADHEAAAITYTQQRGLAAEMRAYGIYVDDVCFVPGPEGAGAADSPWVNRIGADLAFALRPPLDLRALLDYVGSTGRAVTFIARPDWEASHDSEEPITHVAYIATPEWT